MRLQPCFKCGTELDLDGDYDYIALEAVCPVACGDGLLLALRRWLRRITR